MCYEEKTFLYFYNIIIFLASFSVSLFFPARRKVIFHIIGSIQSLDIADYIDLFDFLLNITSLHYFLFLFLFKIL